MATVRAISLLSADGDSGVSGTVKLTQTVGGKTTIEIQLTGLPKGFHGISVNQSGNIVGGCKSCGPVYNPHGKTHGSPESANSCVGSLGNIEAAADGSATKTITSSQVQLIGTFSVIGRSFCVSLNKDDAGEGGHEDSLSSGHVGMGLACGVIGIA